MLEAYLHLSPRYFFSGPSRGVILAGRNRTTGRAVWRVTASNSTQETPGQPARFFFFADSAVHQGKENRFRFRAAWSTPESAGHFRFQEAVEFFFGRSEAFRQSAAIVLRHAVLPLQKIGDALRLNSHFHTA